MKKWLFLTALTALLLGACSTENEVSQENTDKQIGFVQKEDKNSLEKAEKEKLEKLLKDRKLWIEEQKKIEVVRKLFDTLYAKYLTLDRDSDTLELLVANGIVKVPNEDIYYPVLLKKVNFSLDAEKNLISIIDSSDNDFITQELYLNFLAEVENINLDNVFKLGDKIVENNIHPISKNDLIKDFFREFIHNLNPRAEFVEDKKINDDDNIITIEWKPILFIRKKDDGIKYLTETVKRSDISQTIVASGTVRSNNRVEVGAQVSGKITKINVVLGQEVKKGDLIATIDSLTQNNNLDEAKNKSTINQNKSTNIYIK